MTPTHRSKQGDYLAVIHLEAGMLVVTYWHASSPQNVSVNRYGPNMMDSVGNVGDWVKIRKDAKR